MRARLVCFLAAAGLLLVLPSTHAQGGGRLASLVQQRLAAQQAGGGGGGLGLGQGALASRLQQAAAGRAAGAGPWSGSGLGGGLGGGAGGGGGFGLGKPAQNCNKECRAGSKDYCLASIADTCAAKANLGCQQAGGETCDLYRSAKASCPLKTSCPKGYVLKTDSSSTHYPKWKALVDPSSKMGAATGIEAIAYAPAKGKYFDGLFSQLWASAFDGTSPRAKEAQTAYVTNRQPLALALNAFAGRSRHLMHVHAGTSTNEFYTCAEAAAKANNFRTGAWLASPAPCDFTSLQGGGKAAAWVYLEPANSAAPPSAIGQAVWRAFNGGPLSQYKAKPSTTDMPAHHTSLGVTRIPAPGGGHMYATLLANTAAAGSKGAAGEYQLLRS
ncbi:MAG: hypothetical protein J3K34DRAFT_440633 [Monoraphidium minutum]|nr:MAG: hypothetical protein J3K34DRAFT_440633 [Monoraphidium minutum]